MDIFIPTDAINGLGTTTINGFETTTIKAVVPIKSNMNNIERVEFYPPATKLILKNGKEFISVAQDGDEFDKERGVQECLMQYFFGDKSYHTFIRSLIKKDEKEQEIKEKKKADEKAIKEAQIKKEKENREKRIARERAQREYEIEVQKEAYVRAMKEMNNNTSEKEESDC